MLVQTIKNIKNSLHIKTGFPAGVFIAVFLITLFPTTTFAQSQRYAIACHNDAAVAQVSSGKKIVCKVGSKPKGTAYIAYIGKDASKYPKDVTVTIVTVDCGKSQVTKHDVGEDVDTIKCKNGKAAHLTVIKTITKKITYGSCDPTKSITCSPCQPGKKIKGCIDCSNGVCADPAADPNATCNDDRCDLIKKYINPIINLLSMAFGLIAVISIIMGGIQYAASTGDSQKVSAAKQRITNTLIAIVAFFFLYAFLEFLIPGGLFNKSP